MMHARDAAVPLDAVVRYVGLPLPAYQRVDRQYE